MFYFIWFHLFSQKVESEIAELQLQEASHNKPSYSFNTPCVESHGRSSEKMSRTPFRDPVKHLTVWSKSHLAPRDLRSQPFPKKPRALCPLDKFPAAEFIYCPGQPGSQILVTFCIPRASGILIIPEGKIKTDLAFSKIQVFLVELLEPRVAPIIMPFGLAAVILFWFPVPGSLLSRLF